MIKLTEEMKNAVNTALADKAPCLLATASADGKPGIGYRGSVLAYDDSTMAYWERSFRQGSDNVATNPHVVILFRNPETKQAWKFFGEAEIHTEGAIREEVMGRVVTAELDRDADRKGSAVLVRLTKVETMSGEVLMSDRPSAM